MKKNYDIKKRFEALVRKIRLIEECGDQYELNADEAALYLRVSKSTLYRHIAAGNIPYYKLNSKYVCFSRIDLDYWLGIYRIPTNLERMYM